MSSHYGITGFGSYVPRLRLQRAAIACAHAWMAPSLRSQGKGTRAFCNWDEDAITMAVEAARNALAGQAATKVGAVYLASTTLPYADLQNASIAAAAIGTGHDVRTLDLGHSQRGATSGLIDALADGTENALFIATEKPVGRAASVQEIQVGAGAAALMLGRTNVIAECLGHASRSDLFIDHFRAAGQAHDYVWEERWVRDEGYMQLVPPTVAAALRSAGVDIDDIQHLVFPSPMRGVVETVAKTLKFKGAPVDNLADECGYTGSAHALLMLTAALERAQPGEHILVIGFGQGCDAIVLRATAALKSVRPQRLLPDLLADRIVTTDYLRMLSFQGGIELEWGMRSEREAKTALTEVWRSKDMISNFNAGRCARCGTVQFPQLSYCVSPGCNAPRAGFEQLSLRDAPAQVMTITADWLSYCASPPLYVGFVQFTNGARLLMETVDVGPGGLQVGTPLRMVYRIKERDFQRGFDRYFWKATPVNVATLNAPMIADPLDLYDCCGVSDGAAAAIVTTPEIARALGKRDLVTVKAIQLSISSGVESTTAGWDGSYVRNTRTAAARAYKEAGITDPRAELDLIEVHDCFSITELVTMEDLGVSSDGRATFDVLDGFFDADGGLPCQIDGGLKRFGHPIDASGLRMAYKVYAQLLGRGGERQLKDPSIGLTHNLGGVPYLGIAAISILGLH